MKKKLLGRRNFIKSMALTGGVLTFPNIITAAVSGAKAPSNRINIAMIGVGNRGTGVMRWFAGNKDVRFLAVCDPFKSRQKKAKVWLDKQYNGNVVKTYNDFRQMLQRDDIDGVIVCTPDHWHVPIAIYAARMGKDMYVEKPLSISMEWSGQLRETIKRYGSVFQYGTMQRSWKHFRFACELVRNGYIGQIKRVEVWSPDISADFNDFHVKKYGSMIPVAVPAGLDYDMWLGPAPETPYTIDRCTRYGAYHCYDNALGFIAGWGAHPLDIAQWGLGTDNTSPVYYRGSGTVPVTGLYDTVGTWDIYCRYANGIPMRFMCERVAKAVVMKYRKKWCSHGTTFFGTDGWVSVDRTGLYTSNPKLKDVQLTPSEIHLYNSPDHARNFIDCIKSRAKTVNPVETAIRSDTISHLSNICIRTGSAIKWDPTKEKIIGNEQASRMLSRTLRSPWNL